jgi:multiple antibiotic resistance protein
VYELFLNYFVVLFVVVDPIGLAALFAALAHDEPLERQRIFALRATAIATIVLVLFALFGDRLLRSLGIGMPAFQISGGALLFLLAVDMVFARHSGLRATTPDEEKEAHQRKDISVFPLAVPLIAGPGALTTVLLMVGEQGGDSVVVGTVLAVLATVLLITLICLWFSPRIMRFMGATGTNVVGRLLGIILAAMAIQFVLDGWSASQTTPDEEEVETLTITI